MSWIIMFFGDVSRDTSPIFRQGVWVCVCVRYLCIRRWSKYFKVVSDWLTLVVDLYGTILVGGPLWTQFDDVVLSVVFFALLSRSNGFQIFGNLKDIPLIWCSFSSEQIASLMVLVFQFFSKSSTFLCSQSQSWLYFQQYSAAWLLLLADLMAVMCSSALMFNIRFVSPTYTGSQSLQFSWYTASLFLSSFGMGFYNRLLRVVWV